MLSVESKYKLKLGLTVGGPIPYFVSCTVLSHWESLTSNFRTSTNTHTFGMRLMNGCLVAIVEKQVRYKLFEVYGAKYAKLQLKPVMTRVQLGLPGFSVLFFFSSLLALVIHAVQSSSGTIDICPSYFWGYSRVVVFLCFRNLNILSLKLLDFCFSQDFIVTIHHKHQFHFHFECVHISLYITVAKMWR